MRILLVDIGNTSTHVLTAENGSLGPEKRLPTTRLCGADGRAFLRPLSRGAEILVAASVVPAATRALRRLCSDLGVRCLIAGEDLAIPIRNNYTRPAQVGKDRLLNALAAHRLYRKDCIVVDFGTAVTFDVVTASGSYEGGLIAPGIEISIDALNSRTALLPRIRLKHPKRLIGKDTVESIRAGCAYGIGGLCDRIVRRLRREWSPRALVVATGGYARFMQRYCAVLKTVEPLLVPKGLLIAYSESLPRRLRLPFLPADSGRISTVGRR